MHEKLHWLPVQKRVEYKLLTIVYKCIRGIAPDYLQELLKKHVPIRPGLCSGNSSTKLMVPRVTRHTFAARSFSVCGPRLWNSLPDDITAAPTVDQFIKKLKTYMFKQIYDL